jgi:CHAT domain-containing protein/tetratricopeptide (TPR) repeat protein
MVAALFLGANSPSGPRGDPPRTPADSLREVVEPLFNGGLYDSILQILPGYIQRAETTGDSILLGRAITQRGRAHHMQGRYDAAARDLDVAIQIAESVRDTVGLMPAVHFRGFAYTAIGAYGEAMHCFERRLFLALRTRSPGDEAWARGSIAYMLHRGEQLDSARAEYTRAIELFRANQLTALELSPLIGLGRVEMADGNDYEAIRCFQRAWVVASEAGDRLNEMWATNNLGVLEARHGDLSRAAQYLQRAYELARELKSPQAMVIPAVNLAARAESLGDFETAETILNETRALCETQGAGENVYVVDFYRADMWVRMGRRQAGTELLRRLAANRDALQPEHRDPVVMRLAWALAEGDSVDAAVDLLLEYVDRHGRAHSGASVVDVNQVLASLYLKRNDGEKALMYARRARAAAERAGRPRDVIAGTLLESRCLHLLRQGDAATTAFHAALDSLEAFRGGTSTVEWREVYGEEVGRGVVEAGRVLLEYPTSTSQHARDETFFDAMQRVKTRALLDRITEPRFGTAGIDGRWSSHVATARDLQAVLRPGEVVLDFFVGLHRSFLVAVTAESLRVIELPGPDSALAERVELLHGILAATDASLRAQYPPDRLANMQRVLGRALLHDVIDMVNGSERLLVSSDGFYSALSLGVLIADDGDRLLMTDRDIVQIPSASVLVLQRSTAPGGRVTDPVVVAIGSLEPELSGARDEVRDLARRYQQVAVVEGLSGVEAFEEATGRCDVLHIAAHARVIDRSPWESGIRLVGPVSGSPLPVQDMAQSVTRSSILPAADSLLVARTFQSDPYLRAWQIAQLQLPARLAVLSACETAGGRMTSGEGTIGITTAFLSAGVPVIVSSLWSIDDRVTALIMRLFYENLATGKPVATALRLAQLEVSRSADYTHPFYWAGFAVVGDGSLVVDLRERGAWGHAAMVAGLAVVIGALLAIWLRRRRNPISVL